MTTSPPQSINFGFAEQVPVVLQTELTECGLACVAMISCHYGASTSLTELRQRFPLSLKGMTLRQIIDIFSRLHLATRAVRADIEELSELKTPCILHWEFNHFVLLKSVYARKVKIIDPACGERTISKVELSRHFTGVALEVWPDLDFAPRAATPVIKVRELMGKFHGVNGTLWQILSLALALETLALLSPLFMQWVLDNVITSNDTNLLNTLAVGFIVLTLFQQCIGGFRAWIMMYLGTTLSIQWRGNVFRHLLSLPLPYFERRHMGDVVSRFGTVDSILQTLTSSFLGSIIDGVMMVVTVVMMFLYSVPLGLIAVATMLLYAGGRWLWYAPLRQATNDSIIKAAKTQTHFLESVRGIRAIKMFGKQQARAATWFSLVVDQVNAGLKTQKLQLVYQQWNGLLFGMESIVFLWVGANMVMGGDMTVGMLMAFNAYRSRFSGRIGNLIDNFFSIKMLRVQGERLADIVQSAPEVSQEIDECVRQQMTGSLELNDVTFRYAHGEPTIISHISTKIGASECVAIVGKTGSGKTTLLNLILGAIKPTGGEILIGGKDSSLAGPDLIRAISATVMQDDVLFAGSLLDNITFWDHEPDHAWVQQCLSVAQLEKDVTKFPMGLNTLVGDMGSALSAGQKQRVLLARALYKKPKILILDESTSNLDVNTEAAINQALATLPVTRILVAHRLSAIASAARVLYIEDGNLVLDTTPEQFFASGIYACENSSVESTIGAA